MGSRCRASAASLRSVSTAEPWAEYWRHNHWAPTINVLRVRSTILIAAAVVAIAGLLTACNGGESSTSDVTATRSAGGTDRDRLTVIHELRGIDPCALYGGADTAAGQAMTIEGMGSSLGCEARVADPERDLKARISVDVGPVTREPDADWVKHHVIDGVDVVSASAQDSPDAPPRDDVVVSTCFFVARYPDNTNINVMVSAPPDADACEVSEELMRTAIGEFAKRPQLESNSYPHAVLNGADPCTAVERLRPAHRIDWDVSESNVTTCAFSMDGRPGMYVSFSYQDPVLQNFATDYFSLGDHRFGGDQADGIFSVIVGEEFQLADKTLVPEVTIQDMKADGNMDRIRLVAQAIADQF